MIEVSREEALRQIRGRVSSWRTICEVHREIYDIAEELPEPVRSKVMDLVIDSYVMAKKMNDKLREYKSDWDSGLWVRNDLANVGPKRIMIDRGVKT